MSQGISRREMLRSLAVTGAGLLAASCGTTTSAPTATPVVVEVTKVVEKQVTQIVEKQVTQVVDRPITQVVEKVVTATPVPGVVRKVSAPGILPVAKEKVSVKIMANVSKDLKQNRFTQWLTKQTGVDIEWITATSGADAQQKMNLAVASGNVPDVFANFGMSAGDQQVLAQQRVIMPLDSLIEEHGFWFKQVLNAHPTVKPQASLLDGKMYALPGVQEILHTSLGQKMWIYEPWLDKLGLKMPTTTDEFYDVMKAFKSKDPNGNGKADEIPLSCGGGTTGYWQGTLDTFLMQPFVFNERQRTKSLMVDKGVIKASYADPGWQEGLKYLNKMFSDGLIDPQVFSNDRAQITALAENPDVAILGASPAGYWGLITKNGGPSGRYKEYKPVPPLKGPTGLQQIPYNPYGLVIPGHWIIATACKNPEVAFRLGDYFYSFEATMANAWGVKDLDWRDAKPGEVGIGGGPALFATLRAQGADPTTMVNMMPNYQPKAIRLGILDDPKAPTEKWLYDYSEKVYAPFGVQDKILPEIVFTVEQSKELSQLTPVITNLVDQAFAEFVVGKRNPDKDWAAYQKQLQDSGLAKFLKLYQDAYDAKYKK